MTDVSSRELSCKASRTDRQAQASKACLVPRGRLGRQEARPEAVLAARGRLGRQEAHPEAVLGARRPVRRPSWPPGGPSASRLGRQEGRPEAVLNARRPVCRSSWPSGGQNASFTAVLLQNAGFAQVAGWGHRLPSPKASKPPLQYFCIDFAARTKTSNTY